MKDTNDIVQKDLSDSFSASLGNHDRLEISVRNGCGKMCEYCPQDLYIKNYKDSFPSDPKRFTLAMAKSCAVNIPLKTELKWTGFTEPFDCSEFPEIVEFFESQGYMQSISTTLLGAQKNQEFFLENIGVFNAGITLHLPDNEGLMKGRFDVRYSEYVALVLDKLATRDISYDIFLIGENVHSSISHVMEKYQNEIIKAKYLNTRAGTINSTKFNLKNSETIRQHGVKYYCAYKRLNQGVLLPNGKVALCCQDYGLEHILGSLLEDDLPELYTSIQRDHKAREDFEKGVFSPCVRCEHYRPLGSIHTTGRVD